MTTKDGSRSSLPVTQILFPSFSPPPPHSLSLLSFSLLLFLSPCCQTLHLFALRVGHWTRKDGRRTNGWSHKGLAASRFNRRRLSFPLLSWFFLPLVFFHHSSCWCHLSRCKASNEGKGAGTLENEKRRTVNSLPSHFHHHDLHCFSSQIRELSLSRSESSRGREDTSRLLLARGAGSAILDPDATASILICSSISYPPVPYPSRAATNDPTQRPTASRHDVEVRETLFPPFSLSV